MTIRNKMISIILCIAMLLTFRPFVPTTHAWWGYTDINLSDAWNLGTYVKTALKYTLQAAEFAWKKAESLLEIVTANTVVQAKIAAVLAVKAATIALAGGDLGLELIIRDYDNYLFGATTQKALSEMDIFYNTVSKGRSSSLNFEGVGSSANYSKYLESQSRKDIDRMLNPEKYLKPTSQELVADPANDLFSSGNMKALMDHMKCGNNVGCFTLTANAEFRDKVEKKIEIAKIEQKDGILPKKDALGYIKSPALLIGNALTELDNMGMSLIINADETAKNPSAPLQQIFQGTLLSIGARLADYGIKNSAEENAANSAQTSEYPFSLSYNDLTDCTNQTAANNINGALNTVTSY